MGPIYKNSYDVLMKKLRPGKFLGKNLEDAKLAFFLIYFKLALLIYEKS